MSESEHPSEREIDRLCRELRQMRLRAEKAEAELAALKAKAGDEWKARAEAAERHLRDARAMLRIECGEVGDNHWSDDLHLADLIEKHLARPLWRALEKAEAELAAAVAGRERMRAIAEEALDGWDGWTPHTTDTERIKALREALGGGNTDAPR